MTFLKKGLGFGTGAATAFAAVFASLLYAQSLVQFTPGQVVSASEMNQNFTNLNNRVAPIGGIIAWHKSLGGVPTLPVGWVECDGAIINIPGSPLNGRTTPNLNNAPNAWNAGGYFLRGGLVSGTTQVDIFQGHRHFKNAFNAPEADMRNILGGANALTAGTLHPVSALITGDPATGLNGVPRTGGETRPAAFQVVWIMRVQ